jgi:hypothetical protein
MLHRSDRIVAVVYTLKLVCTDTGTHTHTHKHKENFTQKKIQVDPIYTSIPRRIHKDHQD